MITELDDIFLEFALEEILQRIADVVRGPMEELIDDLVLIDRRLHSFGDGWWGFMHRALSRRCCGPIATCNA